MIASWPGKINAGENTEHISAFQDVLPTICELAGIEKPAGIDGISFLPELMGEEQEKHDFLYWEFPQRSGQQAVRMGRWKAVRMGVQKGNLEIKLYDLENDKHEQNNLAAQHPEIVEKVRIIMEEEHCLPAIARFKMKSLGD